MSRHSAPLASAAVMFRQPPARALARLLGATAIVLATMAPAAGQSTDPQVTPRAQAANAGGTRVDAELASLSVRLQDAKADVERARTAAEAAARDLTPLREAMAGSKARAVALRQRLSL
ncbi:MAG: hypothetical protein AAFR47_24540, partial [Pseudomonadota bacterium]